MRSDDAEQSTEQPEGGRGGAHDSVACGCGAGGRECAHVAGGLAANQADRDREDGKRDEKADGGGVGQAPPPSLSAERREGPRRSADVDGGCVDGVAEAQRDGTMYRELT